MRTSEHILAGISEPVFGQKQTYVGLLFAKQANYVNYYYFFDIKNRSAAKSTPNFEKLNIRPGLIRKIAYVIN